MRVGRVDEERIRTIGCTLVELHVGRGFRSGGRGIVHWVLCRERVVPRQSLKEMIWGTGKGRRVRSVCRGRSGLIHEMSRDRTDRGMAEMWRETVARREGKVEVRSQGRILLGPGSFRSTLSAKSK